MNNEKDRSFVVVLDVQGDAKIIRINDENSIIDYMHFCALKSLCKTEIDLFETVSIFTDTEHYVMLLAEDGKLRELPINRIATFMYGALPYDFIVGDVVFVKRDAVAEDELCYLTASEVDRLTQYIGKFKN